MPNSDTGYQSQIDTVRLEGVIREEFARMQGKFDLHTQEIRIVSESMKYAIGKLEKHLEDPDLHKCADHASDINGSFKIGRDNAASIKSIHNTLSEIKADEKVLQGQIKVLKWVAGGIVSFALVAKEVFLWFMNR